MNKQGFKYLIFLFCIFVAMQQLSARTLIHPGVSHKLSDLDRMKVMIKAGKEPWKTSFANLQANSYASYSYTVKWSLDSTRVVESLGSNYEKFKYDALACYYNALEWYITGDARYAEKSVEILNKMKNIRSIQSATESLCAGRVLPKLMEGAEIIKSTYPGWKQDDIDAFKAMLVYPGYSTKTDHSTDTEHSFYWAMYNGDYGRHGNQGLFGMLGTLQIAVFSDNEIMYDRVLRYMRGEKHRSDDLPYVSGPTYVNTNKNTTSSNSYFDDYSLSSPYISSQTADYGYNEVIKNYIWENGQTQEASRDQGHSQLALGLINNICEIAWNQGDDLYSILNYRTLLGWEFYFKYNLSYYKSFTDQPTAWEPTAASGEFFQRRDRSQRWFSKKINPWNANDTTTLTRGTMFSDNSYTTSTGAKTPMYEMALGHYKSRLNLPVSRMKWLSRADSISRKLFGYEREGFQVDFLGFGSLTFHRADSCPGDPVTFVNKVPVYRQNIVPCTIQAEDYDFMTTNGQGRTFYDLSGTKLVNTYRPDSAVTIKPCSAGGYKVADMASGEWLRYSAFIPEYSKYQISINYSAANANGKIKLRIGSQDKTTEISLPATGTGVWADYTLLTDTLFTGIRSVQLIVSGESNAIELNSIKIAKAMIAAKNDYVSFANGDYNTASNWRLSDGAGGVQASVPTAAPTVSNNVWIQAGQTMTAATAAVSAKNMVVNGSLTVGSGTSTAYDVTLGTASAPGSLFIQDSGVLTSTTANGSTVSTLKVYGPTVSVNGQLGSANATTTIGSGIKLNCENEKTVISGIGKVNIARLQSGLSNTINQDIIIDLDLSLQNSASTGATLSLLNGSAGLAEKTVTINEGRTVTFTGGGAGLLHQMSSSTAQTTTGGNCNYSILGKLDTGNGGLYLTTTTQTTNPTQQVNINVGSKGTLIIGPKLIMIKTLIDQSINFNFSPGSNIVYKASVVPTFSSTAPGGITPASFPVAYSNLTIENPNGINLLTNSTVDSTFTLKRGNVILGSYSLTLNSGTSILGASDTTHVVTNSTGNLTRFSKAGINSLFPVGASAKRYDPVIIQPTADAAFNVRVDSVFNVLPKYPSLTNPIEWNITSNPSVSGSISLKPSSAIALTSPVIAQVVNNSWLEMDATLSGTTFTVPVNSFSVFGTGSVTGFGLKSALEDTKWNHITYYTKENRLTLNGLDAGTYVAVYNAFGQLIDQRNSIDTKVDFFVPEKGVYLIELRDNLSRKVLKVVVN